MDTETWVSPYAGGTSDRKIACEPLIGEDKPSPRMDHWEEYPDSPPESFLLSKDAELDWFHRNAFMERKESTKANTNSTNLNGSAHSNTTPTSQTYSLKFKSKIAILGLLKPQNPGLVDAKNRKQGTVHFLPKRFRSYEKLESGSTTEPASPDVSCIGRVRSSKGRRLRNQQRSEAKEKSNKREERKTGFFKSFLAHFSCCCKKKSELKSNQSLPIDLLERKMEVRRARDSTVSELEPPELGDMKRFLSGRRSESWVGEAAERV